MATAVVTGAGRGIGRAIAQRLAGGQYEVVVVDADGDLADKAASDVNGRAERCDVADEAQVAALAERVGPIDALVNNAGIWRNTTLAQEDLAGAEAVLRINVIGTWLMTRHFAERMGSAGGAIVNLTSVIGTAPAAGRGLYPASKAAVVALTRQSALEYASRGIRVNAVGPGLVTTEGTRDELAIEAVRAAAEAGLPLGRIGQPDDIAEAVAFLLSEQAAYITGQVLYVDGGWLADGASSILAPSIPVAAVQPQ